MNTYSERRKKETEYRIVIEQLLEANVLRAIDNKSDKEIVNEQITPLAIID